MQSRSPGSATLQRALDVLEAVGTSEPHGLSAAELARRLSLNRVTVHRILQSFCVRGYVRQEGPGKPYRLGLRLLELGEEIVANLDVASVARPFLQELVDHTKETAHLAVLDNAEAVYVAKVESRHAMRLVSHIGSRVPLYCSALGKALLATCNDTDLDWLVSQQSFDPRTPRTIADPEALRREVARIRRQGFAIDLAENERGVHCIGAAVLGRRGEGVAAVSVSGPAERITRRSIDDYAALVMKAARAMGAELGPTNARRAPE